MRSRAARFSGVALGACALLLAVTARGGIPPPEEQELSEQSTNASARCRPANPGKVTKDHEVVFGRFRNRVVAHIRLRRVRRRGFPRARIEREDCIYEVAIIFLNKHSAQRIARRARKRGWSVRIMIS